MTAFNDSLPSPWRERLEPVRDPVNREALQDQNPSHSARQWCALLVGSVVHLPFMLRRMPNAPTDRNAIRWRRLRPSDQREAAGRETGPRDEQ